MKLYNQDFIRLFFKTYFDIFVRSDNFPRIGFSFISSYDRKIIIDKHLSKYKNNIFYNEVINDIDDNNVSEYPVIYVKDMDYFFNRLNKFYNMLIDINNLKLDEYEAEKILSYIFLRCTSEDFYDIEKFIDRQIEMLDISMFNNIFSNLELGRVKFLNNSLVYGNISPSDIYNECSYEFKFSIKDFDSIDLPVIRFGIYNHNNKKVCLIGSIQNDSDKRNKILERNKYKINSGVEYQELLKCEPKKVISLMLFLNVMYKMGINTFSMHGYTIMDYDFHIKLSEYSLNNYNRFCLNNRDKDGFIYQFYLNEYKKYFNKEDKIIELKTEEFYNLIDRIIYHYKDIEVLSYPYITSSDYIFRINDINFNNINSNACIELFNLINDNNKIKKRILDK